MIVARSFTLAALALGMAAASTPVLAYDNDIQGLRMRDALADPSVPLAWDRRARPETWRNVYDDESYGRRCGKRYYWNGDECVRKRRR